MGSRVQRMRDGEMEGLMGQFAAARMRLFDDRVLEGCRRGDRGAMRALFDAYRDSVYSFALHFFHGDAATAEDVSQDVFVKVLSRIGEFRREAELSTWIYRITTNVCIDEHRRQKRIDPAPVEESQVISDCDPGYDEVANREETATEVRAALAHLPGEMRMTLLLKYSEDLSYGEIAATLGCSKGTVGSRLNRGHKLLAERLAHLKGGE